MDMEKTCKAPPVHPFDEIIIKNNDIVSWNNGLLHQNNDISLINVLSSQNYEVLSHNNNIISTNNKLLGQNEDTTT